jgi:hypothetical protein
MDGTILGQGSFIVPATIVNQVIAIPSAADWVRVVNYTRQGTVGGAAAYGFEYYWQRGMPAGSALVKYYANGGAVVTGDRIATGGFTIYDPSGLQAGSGPLVGAPVVITGGSSNATRPVVTTANTAGIAVGSVVRISSPGQPDVNGVDMVVGAVTPGVSFTLLAASNALANVPGAAGVAGTYRIVNYPSLYYPRRRFVTNITQAVNAQVSTSLEHSLTVGQAVRFNIPAVSGMIELNPTPVNNYLVATVLTIVDAYNFTIDVDTTAFTAFTWPTVAQQPSSFPTVEPIGENTAIGLLANQNVFPQYQGLNVYNANGGVFADATVNTGYYGMILGTGANGVISGAAITGPAGSVAADVVYWVSGKADFGGL